jgi:hypothetical protein
MACRVWRYGQSGTDYVSVAPVVQESDKSRDQHADHLAKAVAGLCDELARLR